MRELLIVLFLLPLLASCSARQFYTPLDSDKAVEIPFYQTVIVPMFKEMRPAIQKKTGRDLKFVPIKSSVIAGPLFKVSSKKIEGFSKKCFVLIAVDDSSWQRVYKKKDGHDFRRLMTTFGVSHEIAHCLTDQNYPWEQVANTVGAEDLSHESLNELVSDLLALSYLERTATEEEMDLVVKHISRLRSYSFTERLVTGSEYNYGHLVTVENARAASSVAGFF